VVATGSRCCVQGKSGPAAETALAIAPAIMAATAQPRVIGPPVIGAIVQRPPTAPKVAASAPRPPIAVETRPGGGSRDIAFGNVYSGRAASRQSARGQASLRGRGGGAAAFAGRGGGGSQAASSRGGGGGGFRGGGGGFRGGGGGRRSDIALKHDIVLLGHLPNGLGCYRFSYLGSNKAYVGVMAQEVQGVMPEAVTRGSDGYLRVYYDRLGLKLRTYTEWLSAGAKIPTRSEMSR
jgi:hypothetical protein